jgi:DNA primase
MRIPEATISEVRARTEIAEVVGEHVALQRKGARYWGLCPFHQEKSPSFSVTPDKGVFYCFGCHKGGTVFDFVMEVEKVQWRDAVEILARRAGIVIPREEEEPGGISRETFFELHRRVAGTFHWLLREGGQAEAARAYLAGRGVSAGMIESFQIGYAPLDRQWLFRFLTQKSYSADFLARTGLFMAPGENRSAGAALFANRIMFPIANARGEVLAFGGRALGDAQPKYLNSPETAFFRKGENLFGMDKAVSAIRAAGAFVLVEGYMDVLAMHQAGITNCVAPLGTALTEAQVRVLKRQVGKAILVFDGDQAGQKATQRAIELLEAQDLIAQVVELPEGQDPADLVQNGQTRLLERLLGSARDSFPYLVEKAAADNDLGRPEGRERMRDALFPFIAAPSSQLRRDGYLTQLADALGADAGAVKSDFGAWLGGQRRFGRQGRGIAEAPRPGQDAVTSDLFLMLAVAANRELFQQVRGAGIALADLDDERARTLFVALEEAFRAEEPGFDALAARIEDAELRALAIRKISSGEFDMNQPRLVADGVRRIRRRALGKRIDMLGVQLRKAEREGTDPARMRELLAEKMHLDSELERLKTRAAGV